MYITPPKEREVIDRYFEMGADRIACSLEVWDDRLAEVITPVSYTHLDVYKRQGLRTINKMGFGYKQLAMDMNIDYPRAEFYNVMFKKWGLETGEQWDFER